MPVKACALSDALFAKRMPPVTAGSADFSRKAGLGLAITYSRVAISNAWNRYQRRF
jgi:hypothetical protein